MSTHRFIQPAFNDLEDFRGLDQLNCRILYWFCLSDMAVNIYYWLNYLCLDMDAYFRETDRWILLLDFAAIPGVCWTALFHYHWSRNRLDHTQAKPPGFLLLPCLSPSGKFFDGMIILIFNLLINLSEADVLSHADNGGCIVLANMENEEGPNVFSLLWISALKR